MHDYNSRFIFLTEKIQENHFLSNTLFINRKLGNQNRLHIETGIGYTSFTQNIPPIYFPDIGSNFQLDSKEKFVLWLPYLNTGYTFAYSFNKRLSHQALLHYQMTYQSSKIENYSSHVSQFLGADYQANFLLTSQFSIQLQGLINVNINNNTRYTMNGNRYLNAINGGIAFHF